MTPIGGFPYMAMVFSSLAFLFYFLPICLAIYYAVPKSWKNTVLCLTGFLFYAWGEPVYVFFMLLCVCVNFFAGLAMERFDDQPRKRRAALIVSLVFSLGLLAVCKYSGFFFDTIGVSVKTLPLPIGISFYTFQSMSYTIDLYRKHIPVQRNLVDFGAYVAMFPQIIAGPIVRYADVAAQLRERTLSMDKIGEGVGIFVIGLAKKVLLANNIGLLWTEVKSTAFSELSAVGAWIGILAFTFQIYFDFSGYSDMAIGMGKMLGFDFPENFRYPYCSHSVSEFWRRWHMTLGTWFREYVYIPLGGNRKGKSRTVLNLLIVWTLTGLWHGASWNFVLWGLYFGLLIVAERLWIGEWLARIPAVFSQLYAFLLVVFGWVLFDTSRISDAGRFLLAMFGANHHFLDDAALYQIRSYWMIFVLCVLASLPVWKTLREKSMAHKSVQAVSVIAVPVVQCALFCLCVTYLVNASYNPFLYFRF